MATIVYGICGEGAGHAIRSSSIIDHLLKDHKVHIFAAERAYEILRDRYDNIHRIPGKRFIYADNAVRYTHTLARTITLLPHHLITTLPKVIRQINQISPSLIITDFEGTVARAARYLHIPLISIDNIQQLRFMRLHSPWEKVVQQTIKIIQPQSDISIITSLDQQRDTQRVKYIPPLIREICKKFRPQKGRHILVYQTSSTNTDLLRLLQDTKTDAIVYGFNHEETKDTVKLKNFHEEDFLRDLSTCRYVICNGGFTVLSEALYYGKPILVEPIRQQIEQIYNAKVIRKREYGDYCERLDRVKLQRFEDSLPRYEKRCARIRWDDPLAKIDEILSSFL